MVDIFPLDICDVRGAQTAQPPGSGCFQRAPHRVHQTAGRDYSGPRDEPPQPTKRPSKRCGGVSHAEVQELSPGENLTGKGYKCLLCSFN